MALFDRFHLSQEEAEARLKNVGCENCAKKSTLSSVRLGPL